MRRAAFFALIGLSCAGQASLAQTSLVDGGTGVFVPFAGTAAFTQAAPAGNANNSD